MNIHQKGRFLSQRAWSPVQMLEQEGYLKTDNWSIQY